MNVGHVLIGRVMLAFDVQVIVIGGVAAQLRGWPEVTLDLDLVPAPDRDNLRRLARALNDLEVRWRVAGSPDGHPLAAPLDVKTIEAHASLAFVSEHGPLDIVLRPDGIADYAELARTATTVDVDGWTVKVASTSHIIRSKQAADRLKDRAQLPGLLAAFRAAGELPPEIR